MTRAETCIPRVLVHEGGFVDHPRDPGGATNKGITIATYRRYIDPKGTVADLRAMTEAQAVRVYKGEYWDAVKADDLPIGVDYAVFDFGVNSGPGRAIPSLQRVVGVADDGKLGPLTLAAVRKMPASVIINQLCFDRLAFMRRLSTWDTFGKGWQRRVDDVREAALNDAAASLPELPNSAPIAAEPDAYGRLDKIAALARQIQDLTMD